MLHPDKLVTIIMPVDVAYGIMGNVMLMRQHNALVGAPGTTEEEMAGLSAQYKKVVHDIIRQLAAHDYSPDLVEAGEVLENGGDIYK